MQYIIIMMNIKNIFVTTSISIFFGVYSLYNIVNYIQKLEIKHNNQVEKLNKIIDETYKKYENIKYEYLKIKDEFVSLNNKIQVLEEQILKKMQPNINYISSESDLSLTDSNGIICDALCELSPDKPLLPTRSESSNSLDSVFDFESNTVVISTDLNSSQGIMYNSTETINKLNEIFDEIGIKRLSLKNPELDSEVSTPPPTKNSSFCGSETSTNTNTNTRKRSISVNEVNWIDITKKFIFG